MTALERRHRWLLRAYPAWYRSERGEEILATLLEASPAGRSWPSPRDARALIIGGLRVRARGNQRLTTAAGVRQAVLLGAALALVWFASNVLGRDVAAAAWSPGANPDIGYWIAWDALALAAPLGAWLAPRPVVAVSALAPAAVWAWQYWGDWMVIEPAGWLILLAILVYGRERLPRSWLWLAGAISAANILDQLTIAPLYASHGPLHTPLAIALWIILGVVVFWAAVDARPALAMAIWLALYYLIPSLLGYIAHGVIGIAGPGPWQWPWQWYLLAAGSVVLSAAALWRLRHQAAL